jgi:hypothetical protein
VNKLTNPALRVSMSRFGARARLGYLRRSDHSVGWNDIAPEYADLRRHCLVSIRSTSVFPIAARWMAVSVIVKTGDCE